MKPWLSQGFFMSLLQHLSYSKQRKDQGPNKELASKIVSEEDYKAVEELVLLLQSQPHKEHQKDLALTLAWISESNPDLTRPYLEYFVSLLHHPINRVIWASMMSLSALAPGSKEPLFFHLPVIIDAMNTGSVVTRDHGFRIMVVLYATEEFAEDLIGLIYEQLLTAPSNQLGQYTERVVAVLRPAHKEGLIHVLEQRREEVDNPHHLNRLNKNLKKLWH